MTNLNLDKYLNIVNKEKIKLCIEIMENYYDGVIGIANFFNLNLSKDYF